MVIIHFGLNFILKSPICPSLPKVKGSVLFACWCGGTNWKILKETQTTATTTSVCSRKSPNSVLWEWYRNIEQMIVLSNSEYAEKESEQGNTKRNWTLIETDTETERTDIVKGEHVGRQLRKEREICERKNRVGVYVLWERERERELNLTVMSRGK